MYWERMGYGYRLHCKSTSYNISEWGFTKSAIFKNLYLALPREYFLKTSQDTAKCLLFEEDYLC